MTVSNNAAYELRDFRANILARDTADLSSNDTDELNAIMGRLRQTVLAEAKEVSAFFPREKRYPVNALFDDPKLIIGVGVFESLIDNARDDVSEACSCILLERPTAASFHLMRAAEGTLKQLYLSIVKRGRKEPPLWAAMVKHLDERKELDEALKGMLDVWRKGFRNPTAHPDKFYSIDEAQDMLATTIQILALLVSHKKYDRDAT